MVGVSEGSLNADNFKRLEKYNYHGRVHIILVELFSYLPEMALGSRRETKYYQTEIFTHQPIVGTRWSNVMRSYLEERNSEFIICKSS